MLKTIIELGNFVALAGLFAFLGKRYFGPMIKGQLANQQEALDNLKNQKEQLQVDQSAIDNRLSQQQVLTQDLENKILRWRVAFERNEQQKQLYAQECVRKVVKKVELQNKQVEMEVLQKQLLPKVIEASMIELKKQFSSDKQGQAYLAHLITYMERSQS